MAATIAGMAVAAAATGSSTGSVLMLMSTTKVKASLLGTALAASLVTSVVFQVQSQHRLRQASAEAQNQDAQLAARKAEHQQLAAMAALASEAPLHTRAELERRRGEVAALRTQTGHLGKLQLEQNRLQDALADARGNGPGPRMEPTVESQQVKAATVLAQDLARAVRFYASEHEGQFPTNLAEALTYLPADRKARIGDSSDQFELVVAGPASDLEKFARPGGLLLVRQRAPWKNTDGKLVKAYAFYDGSVSVVGVENNQFEDWENQHRVAATPPP